MPLSRPLLAGPWSDRGRGPCPRRGPTSCGRGPGPGPGSGPSSWSSPTSWPWACSAWPSSCSAAVARLGCSAARLLAVRLAARLGSARLGSDEATRAPTTTPTRPRLGVGGIASASRSRSPSHRRPPARPISPARPGRRHRWPRYLETPDRSDFAGDGSLTPWGRDTRVPPSASPVGRALGGAPGSRRSAGGRMA